MDKITNKYSQKEIQDETNQAIHRGYESANEKWKEYALLMLNVLAKSRTTFTVDDLRAEVDKKGYITHDKRAMGGIIRTGLARGWFSKTGQIIPSKTGHGIPMQVWQSKIYAFAQNND